MDVQREVASPDTQNKHQCGELPLQVKEPELEHRFLNNGAPVLQNHDLSVGLGCFHMFLVRLFQCLLQDESCHLAGTSCSVMCDAFRNESAFPDVATVLLLTRYFREDFRQFSRQLTPYAVHLTLKSILSFHVGIVTLNIGMLTS